MSQARLHVAIVQFMSAYADKAHETIDPREVVDFVATSLCKQGIGGKLTLLYKARVSNAEYPVSGDNLPRGFTLEFGLDQFHVDLPDVCPAMELPPGYAEDGVYDITASVSEPYCETDLKYYTDAQQGDVLDHAEFDEPEYWEYDSDVFRINMARGIAGLERDQLIDRSRKDARP